MARGSLLSRFLRPRRDHLAPPADDAPAAPLTGGGAPAPESVPPATVRPGPLRRERRRLVHVREERVRDLGGLMLEMFRQNRFREDLVRAHCEELVRLDSRLQEIEALLATVATERSQRGRKRARATGRCTCGAPLVAGVHFCANCGRPAEGAAPVIACVNCEHPLPGDANFCAVCGTAVELEDDYREVAAAEHGDTADDLRLSDVRQPGSDAPAGPEREHVSASTTRPEPPPDRWER